MILWGKYEVSDDIKDKLKGKYGLDVTFYVDSDIKKIDNMKVFSTDCLDGKSSEYYVVIPLAFYQSVREKMTRGGYQNEIDYFYFCDCVVCQREDYYEDTHGNKIVGKYQGLKFAFSGFGSLIQIGDNVHFQNTTIYIHSNLKIVIGNESCFHDSEIWIGDSAQAKFGDGVNLQHTAFKQTRWYILAGSDLKIGSRSRFFYGYLHVGNDASLQIGDDFTIGEDYTICAYDYTSVSIGADCMFSNSVIILGSDGHSIFDIMSGENINSTYEIVKNQKIDIGNHVWVGMRVTIIYDTKIGDGSIVGTSSLVKGAFPNNCIVAGVPANVIRRNIAWSRKNGVKNISECGDQYVNCTK